MTLAPFRWIALAVLVPVAAGLLWTWWCGRWEGKRLNGLALLLASVLLQELERPVRGTPAGWVLFGLALAALIAGIVVSIRDVRAHWREQVERVRHL